MKHSCTTMFKPPAAASKPEWESKLTLLHYYFEYSAWADLTHSSASMAPNLYLRTPYRHDRDGGKRGDPLWRLSRTIVIVTWGLSDAAK